MSSRLCPVLIYGTIMVLVSIISPISSKAATGGQQSSATGEKGPWTALGLDRTNVRAASFYVEKSLIPKVEAVKNLYQEFCEQEQTWRKEAEVLVAKGDDIVDEVNRLLGAALPSDTKQSQKRLITRVVKDYRPLSERGARFSLCLVTQSTIKNFLRNVGSLEGFTYERGSDTVLYSVAISQTNAGDRLTLTIPATSLETVEADTREAFTGRLNYAQILPGIALHELIEGTLQE